MQTGRLEDAIHKLVSFLPLPAESSNSMPAHGRTVVGSHIRKSTCFRSISMLGSRFDGGHVGKAPLICQNGGESHLQIAAIGPRGVGWKA